MVKKTTGALCVFEVLGMDPRVSEPWNVCSASELHPGLTEQELLMGAFWEAGDSDNESSLLTVSASAVAAAFVSASVPLSPQGCEHPEDKD